LIIVSLSAGLFEEQRVVTMESVIDVDDFGETLGIEIIGPRMIDSRIDWTRTVSQASIHVAYDQTADAVYIRLVEGRIARDQNLRSASVHVDAGDVVRMISYGAH